ncbi:MAG: type II toxin-antitoxin system RelE/ParE family toxin [Chloroflexi bacterium]|nr:type II toxin-antitoxin system RelE/ParE family toxin [Chloroflexota bacterium]
MTYDLLILRRAQKELSGLPEGTYERVKLAIYQLADNPKPRGSRKLTGREGWRIRVGDYRVIYEIDYHSHSVTVLHVGHRRDVYR